MRVLIANWVEPDGDGSTLVSEARVAPVDRRAALRLRSLWMVIGVFERLIGGEALALAADRASHESRGVRREVIGEQAGERIGLVLRHEMAIAPAPVWKRSPSAHASTPGTPAKEVG